jgi:hypothetical protein
MHDLVHHFADDYGIIHLAVLVHDPLGFLLELLGTDLVATDASRIEHAPRRDLPEPLREQLRIHEVTLQGFRAAATPEHIGNPRYLDLVAQPHHETVLIERNLVDHDIVCGSYTGEHVTECCV